VELVEGTETHETSIRTNVNLTRVQLDVSIPGYERVIFDEKKERNTCESSTSGAFQKFF